MMSDDRFLNELIIEQQLLEDTSLLLKKKQSLNKFLLLSLNETNDHLNEIFLNIIQRQNRLFNYLLEEKDQYIQRQTFENLLNQILSNEHLIIDKLKRIYNKLNTKKRRRKKPFISRNRPEQIKISIDDIKQVINRIDQESSSQIQAHGSNDEILKIYWRSKSSNNLFKKPHCINMKKSSSDTCLGNNIKQFSLFNQYSTNIQWNFPKLKKINRIHPRTTISENQ